MILLCRDGLWGPLKDEELAGGLGGGAPVDALKRLMDLAELRAGAASDNLSAVLLKWGAAEPEARLPPGESAVVVVPAV